ncbi:hypothetical protein ACTQI9_10135 [Staphylococcus aureus]
MNEEKDLEYGYLNAEDKENRDNIFEKFKYKNIPKIFTKILAT